MADDTRIRPRWWVKPMNKVFMFFSCSARPDEFEALVGRCAVFRFDPV
jgi:hypothetical protein